MPTRSVVVGILVAAALAGFLLNPNAPLGAAAFGPPVEFPTPPSAGQTGALLVISVLEAVAFGVGVTFLLFGLPAVRRAVDAPGFAVPAWLAVSWFLLSWVPHSALHMTAGHDVGKLVAIEYAFHATLVLGAFVLAGALRAVAKRRAALDRRSASSGGSAGVRST